MGFCSSLRRVCLVNSRKISFLTVSALLCYVMIFALSRSDTLQCDQDGKCRQNSTEDKSVQKLNSISYKCLELPGTFKESGWKKNQLGFLLTDPKSQVRHPSDSAIDSLLNSRRLTLLATQLMNQQIMSNPSCVRWWTNPLSASFISSRAINNVPTRHWVLTFELEPGRIPIQVVLKQNTSLPDTALQHLQYQREFTLKSVRVLSSSSVVKDQSLCLCKTEQLEAENRTMIARVEWNKTDPELKQWPPNASFMLSDYMNFLDQSFFLISPGKYGNRNTKYCGSSVKIIVTIHSAPWNFKMRTTIRRTYGSQWNLDRFHARLLFFLGTTEPHFQNLINKEVEDFDDIVQGNFVDSYHNLTLKRLSIFQWIYLQCNKSSEQMPALNLKADDDYLLNIGLALQLSNANPQANLIGFMVCTTAVRETFSKKWYIPRYVYPSDWYNPYLSGVGAITRSKVFPNVLKAALTVPLIHVDDVYVGAIIRDSIGETVYESDLFAFTMRVPPSACGSKRYVISRVSDSDDMLDQWTGVLEPLPENCSLSDLDFNAKMYNCWLPKGLEIDIID